MRRRTVNPLGPTLGLHTRHKTRRVIQPLIDRSAPAFFHTSVAASSPTRIAVVGGGLSGLVTTLYLSRYLPAHNKIILYEGQSRLGGWIESESCLLPESDSPTKPSIVLEGGPRSIRPKGFSGWNMIELIHSLKLMDRLIIVPASHPSARNRFISFRGRLNKLPSSLLSALKALFTLPVLRSTFPSIIPALLLEPFRPSRFERPSSESEGEILRQQKRENLIDEDVETFMQRRFGQKFGSLIVNNLLSAVLHGIYAADAHSLSVRSTLPFLWHTEQKHGSLLRALLPSKLNKRFRHPSALEAAKTAWEENEIRRIKTLIGPDYAGRLESASVYSFREGIGEIVKAVQGELLRRPNVEIRTGEQVDAVTLDDSGNYQIRTARSSDSASRIIFSCSSVVTAAALQTVAPSKSLQNLLRYNPGTTVAVANFAIPCEVAQRLAPDCHFLNHRSKHITGDGAFGFLIPRCESQEKEDGTINNKEGVLGVVFDSDAIPNQDQVLRGVIKLTVMIGGPHFQDGSENGATGLPCWPSEEEILSRARSALNLHLGISISVTTSKDVIARARLQKNCIPTYLPGHFSRMEQLHHQICKLDRVTVTGASYTGVSLNDIASFAKATAGAIVKAEETGTYGPISGLESFVKSESRPAATSPIRSLPFDVRSTSQIQLRRFATSVRSYQSHTGEPDEAGREIFQADASDPDLSDESSTIEKMRPLAPVLSSKTSRCKLTFLYLDIFGTLLHPRKNPGILYATLAAENFGLSVDPDKAARLFPAVLAEMQLKYPNYGKGSDGFPSSFEWWAAIIDRVILGSKLEDGNPRDVTPLKPMTVGREALSKARNVVGQNASYETLYHTMRPRIVERCIEAYQSGEGYFPPIEERAFLSWIRDQNKRRQERGKTPLRVGFASNSDEGILKACHAAGLTNDVSCLSYHVGASKPDPAFFTEAIAKAQVKSPGEILVVGDSFKEDVLPAARAGMRAILLRKVNMPPRVFEPKPEYLDRLDRGRREQAMEQFRHKKKERDALAASLHARHKQELQALKAECPDGLDFDVVQSIKHVQERLIKIWAEEDEFPQECIEVGGHVTESG